MDDFFKMLALYALERDLAIIAVIESESLEAFKAFVNKWQKIGFYPRCFRLPADEVLEIACRKMALHATRIPESTKTKAASWLISRGYDLEL